MRAGLAGVLAILGLRASNWRGLRPDWRLIAALAAWTALAIALLVGLVVGGLTSIPGALFGALFIQFVPNLADQVSKSAPAAIYGFLLIALMYLMPMGVMGLLKRIWTSLRPSRPAVTSLSDVGEQTSTLKETTP